MMAAAPESQDRPLFLPLTRPHFEAFRNGSKTTEYRPLGARWNEQTCWVGRPVLLCSGHSTHRIHGTIIGFHRSTRISTSKPWLACYGPGKCVVACIKIQISSPPATCGEILKGCEHTTANCKCGLVGACPCQIWHDEEEVGHE